jgi:hypothetical protein
VVTWCEAILENPRQVLNAQVQRAKGERVAELKAAGVPYEERMEALEEVSWPKPLGEQIFAFYNAYQEKHPWVGEGDIRPKSILREMVETYVSFAQYVNELGLQRSEGVLLRYLTEAYKALAQNVPPEHHTEQLLDVVSYVRAMLARVDSSLLTEWEKLVAGGGVSEEPPPIDISADRRRFAARVRAELHAVVRALARRDWEEAAISIRRADDGPWGPDELEKAMDPFFAEFSDVAFDHRSRLSEHTVLTATGLHQWTVTQRLLPKRTGPVEAWDEEPDDGNWAIEGRIDLRADTNPQGPLVEIVAIRGDA